MCKCWNSGALIESSMSLSIFVWESCCQFLLQLPRLEMHLSSWVRSSSCFSCMSVQSCSFDWGDTTVTFLYWKKIQIYPQQFAQIFICPSVHEQKPYIFGLVGFGFFFSGLKDWKILFSKNDCILVLAIQKSPNKFPFHSLCVW